MSFVTSQLNVSVSPISTVSFDPDCKSGSSTIRTKIQPYKYYWNIPMEKQTKL